MSAKKIVYPLEDVLKVKERRVEEAEKQLRLRQQELDKEIAKLKEREKERDLVKTHYQDKLTQIRGELDRGTTSPKIRQMKDYLKVVKDKLVIEEKKVKDQEALVAIAKKNVEAAKRELDLKRKEVDKLKEHKTDWLKGIKREIELEEAKDQDELGNISYSLNQRKER
jgi:hypothetical protein